ncbi:MAG TPA: Gfo/Idh/MocA family oxidoreductase [Verrucomicrobiae bacterium]|nr:Gfo/Idh/MocA family oxidoreductase [Verrucomicrobiae bacterium]
MKRRHFIKRVAQTAAALSATSALSAERVIGANERVHIGLVGCGGRGMFDAKLMRDVPNVEFVAVCDLYPPRLARAKEWAGTSAKESKDFRRLLEQENIDALLIATPDHWHAIPTVLACQAGKDVYVSYLSISRLHPELRGVQC